VPAVLSDALRLSDPTSTGAFDDLQVATKVCLLQGSHAAVGIRFATRLPNAKHPSGLGQDTADFYVSTWHSQTIGTLTLVQNVGLGILGDPVRPHRSVDSLLFGASATERLTSRLAILASVDGRTGPNEPGLEPRGLLSIGIGLTSGRMSFRAAGTHG